MQFWQYWLLMLAVASTAAFLLSPETTPFNQLRFTASHPLPLNESELMFNRGWCFRETQLTGKRCVVNSNGTVEVHP